MKLFKFVDSNNNLVYINTDNICHILKDDENKLFIYFGKDNWVLLNGEHADKFNELYLKEV